MIVFIRSGADKLNLHIECKMCKAEHTIELDAREALAFMKNPTLECFPDLNQELRFLIFTGICGECCQLVHGG